MVSYVLICCIVCGDGVLVLIGLIEGVTFYLNLRLWLVILLTCVRFTLQVKVCFVFCVGLGCFMLIA